jgi:hypothetical protein
MFSLNAIVTSPSRHVSERFPKRFIPPDPVLPNHMPRTLHPPTFHYPRGRQPAAHEPHAALWM